MPLYHKCPMCGSKFDIVKVVPWRRSTNGDYRLAGVDKDNNVCCSYNDFRYDTVEAASLAGSNWTTETLEEFDMERQEEAMAVTDEHGYFFDYGPCDSDPYDY